MKHETATAPNKPLQRTPLGVERDRGDFEIWIRPDSFSRSMMAAPLNGRALVSHYQSLTRT